MTARILVVDDVVANVRLLEARLTSEYYDVAVAYSGADALALVAATPFDLVLLDVMMPGLDGLEVCRRIKADPRTALVPVVMVTALDQVADRVRGLEAGADDFLTKPVGDVALLTRVRSLVRLKQLTDALHAQAAASRIGGEEPPRLEDMLGCRPGRVLLVDDRPGSSSRIVEGLEPDHLVDLVPDPAAALFDAAEGNHDLVMVDLQMTGSDPLRLCSQLRSLERTRLLPILVIASPEDGDRLMRGLDLGVNDYLLRPIDREELLARVRTQVRRKRYNDQLRDSVFATMELAVVDPLTSLHNRRYLDAQVPVLISEAVGRQRPLSVLMLDIDHFKHVNDRHGHAVGDEVLRSVARVLRANVRGIDIACRQGGEEFAIVMPDTEIAAAGIVAERIRQKVAAERFTVPGCGDLAVTVSVGIACLISSDDSPRTLLDRADQALYRAKHDGRNRVAADAA
jgi:two-component system cell cycle response regulator